MAMQEEQEGWDYFKFQEDLINDFALYEQQFLAPYPDPESAFKTDPQQQQLDLEEMIEWPDDGRMVELKTGQVDMVDGKLEFTRVLEENEKFLISDFPDPSFQRILFEIFVSDDLPKRTKKSEDCTTANEKKIKRREAGNKYYLKKKKHIEDIRLQIQKLRIENMMRKKVVKFLEISKEVGTFPRRLARATSGPLPSY